jgi:phytanoyl-CoA hydroxylase
MTRKLTPEELETYDRDGYLVIHDAVPAATLQAIIDECERMHSVAYTVAGGTAMLDVDPAHTPEKPRVRRIKSPFLHSDFFKAFTADPIVMDLLEPLMPSGIRLHNAKINMKSAGVGEAIEWHQDWGFYPHTNDDVLAVGIYLDDCTEENGPMLVVPGSHKGPTYNHHANGYFCGAIDPDELRDEIPKAVPLTGPAGTLTIHHARLLHGSAFNRSSKPRRFFIQSYAALDAWPLTDLKGGLDGFNGMIVKGEPTVVPRFREAPVRIPLPNRPDLILGSIYDNQKPLQHRFFDEANATQDRRVVQAERA